MGIFLNRGIQEFDSVVNSKIYVDKTDLISYYNSVINTEQRYACVSRPRRFGKSITANMLAAYYEKGSAAAYLFENRKLGQTPEWKKHLNRYNVIRIDLADIRSAQGSGEKALNYIEKNIILELQNEFPSVKKQEFDELADYLARINEQTGAQFVIIIDEWDCLFRDDKNDTEIQKRYVNLLCSLFKGNRAKNFTALAYMTGILPIKKYNSESALNNFKEYTMLNPGRLAEYIGFTEKEVADLCEEYGMNYEQAKEWYDGYSFKRAQHIYGPNSIVNAMLDGEYQSYWSQTVVYHSLASYITMNFDGLKDDIKIMLGGQRVKVKVRTFENDMVNFKSKHDVMTALIHLGYLAFDSDTEEAYIPNKEVRICFEDTLEATGWDEVMDAIEQSEDFLRATLAEDEGKVASQIDLCHMQNTSIRNYNDENALAAVLALAYYTARKDYHIFRELPTGYGFADLVLIPKEGRDLPAMVLELKWNKKVSTAITQIKEKKYPAVLSGWKKDILLVGISYEKNGNGAKQHTCVIEKIF